LVSDVFPEKATASVVGIGGMVGAVSGIVADVALGSVHSEQPLFHGESTSYWKPLQWLITLSLLYFTLKTFWRVIPKMLMAVYFFYSLL